MGRFNAKPYALHFTLYFHEQITNLGQRIGTYRGESVLDHEQGSHWYRAE